MSAEDEASVLGLLTYKKRLYDDAKNLTNRISIRKTKGYKKYANAYEKLVAGDKNVINDFLEEAKAREEALIKKTYYDAKILRLNGKDISTYNFPIEDRNVIANNIRYLVAEAGTKSNKETLHHILNKLIPEVKISDEYIDEVISYYSDIESISSPYIFNYSNPYRTFIKEVAANYSSINDSFRIMEHYISMLNKDFSFVVAVGPGDRPYSIIIPDDEFKVKFLDKNLVVFVFERDDVGWGNLTSSAFEESSLYKFLESEYDLSGGNYTITNLSDRARSIKFKYKETNVDIVYLNTYYIGIYKPLVRMIVEKADRSLFLNSISYNSNILELDMLIRMNFTYYLHGPFEMNNIKDSKTLFLLNLNRANSNPLVYDLVNEFINKQISSETKLRREELKTRLEDPTFSTIIQFAGSLHFWNILQGGKRKSRRNRWKRQLTRRR